MKKGLLVLCSIGILSLSLVACDGKESKINNSVAEDIVKDATEDTIKNTEEVLKGDFIGVSSSSSNDVTAKIKITDNGMEMSTNVSMSQKTEIAANIDVAKLDTEDPSAIEFYTLLSAKEKQEATVKNGKDVVKGPCTESANTEEVGLNLGVLTQVSTTTQGGHDYVQTDTINLIERGMYGEMVSEVKNAIDSYNDSDMPSLGGDLGDIVNPEMVLALTSTIALSNLFFSGKIDTEAFVSGIEGILDVQLSDVERTVAITLANLIKDNNPMDYLSYTQIKNKAGLTIKASFDYNKWKKAFTKNLAGIVNNYNQQLESYAYLHDFQIIVENTLPESLDVTYAVTISNGTITKTASSVSAKGTLTGSFIGALTGDFSTLSQNGKIDYEVSASAVNEQVYGNTPVTVKKLSA